MVRNFWDGMLLKNIRLEYREVRGNVFDAIFESYEFEKIPYRQAAFMCVLNPALKYFEPSRVKKSQFPDWHVQQRGFVRRFLWIEVLIVRRMQEPCHRFDIWMELIRESTNRCH